MTSCPYNWFFVPTFGGRMKVLFSPLSADGGKRAAEELSAFGPLVLITGDHLQIFRRNVGNPEALLWHLHLPGSPDYRQLSRVINDLVPDCITLVSANSFYTPKSMLATGWVFLEVCHFEDHEEKKELLGEMNSLYFANFDGEGKLLWGNRRGLWIRSKQLGKRVICEEPVIGPIARELRMRAQAKAGQPWKRLAGGTG